ncbi:uncharacterized protein AB9X84_015992 [Acanthopagrus schlegelii]
MFSSPPPVPYHGLQNQGETCYLNSVLQVLFMTEDFRAAVERHCCENTATECIDRQLRDLFDDLKGQTADTYNITRKLGIHRVYEQQDAAEYYEKILSLTSPDASQIFHGWLTDRTTCSACGTETDTDGAFWHLPLALTDSCSEHYSVVDGIKKHFRASEFSGENQMYCEQCDAKCDATTQCVMKHHPEVLMLLLKRFDFDYSDMTYVKINQTVDVPRTLQIPENQTYELYAVVDHSGDLSSGFYTATIWDDEKWFNFFDSRVTLADHQPFQENNFEESCSAYLLFYRKKNATQTTRAVSAPGGHQPATGDVYDQCQDLGRRRGREEEEAIDGDQEKERVRSRGVELHRTQEVRQDYDLKPVSEDKQRDERGGRTDDEEEKTEAGEKGIASEIGKLNHDYGRDGGSKQNMLKHDHQRREERIDAQEVAEQERGDGKQHAQSKDTSATERYPTEGVQAQDSDGVRRDDASVHCEQKIRIMPTIQEDVELDKKGKIEVHDRGMGSGTTKLLTIYDLLYSSENQDDRRVDDNKQKVPKDDQRWKEGGSSRHEGHEQEREGRRDVKGVTEQNRGDSKQPHFGQDVEDQSIVGLDDRQRMSELKISGTYPSHQDDGAETQSKHMQNRSDSSLRQAGSAGSSKPAECQGAGRGEKVTRSNPQPKPTLEFAEPTREESPGSKDIEIKITDTEIRSETVPRSSVCSDLRQAGSAGSSKPANSQLKPTLEFPESTREESPGSKGIEIKITDTEIRSETLAGTSSEGKLSKRFARLKVSESFPTKPKKRAIQKTVGNAQEEESRVTKKQKL